MSARRLVIFAITIFYFFQAAALHSQEFKHGPQTNGPQTNWPQWRGPLANGVAPGATPPLTWDSLSNIKWKTAIAGEGTSTPIVWDDKVFVVSAVQTQRKADKPPVKHPQAMTDSPPYYFQFTVWCLGLDDGKLLWKDIATEVVPREGRHNTNTYAAASPMTDGRRLIVSFGSHGIFSYSPDGEKQWFVDLGDLRTRRGWGEATSPVLAGEKVIVNWDGEDESFIFCLDATTGETLWKQPRDEPTTWATPLVVQRNGKRQVVTNGTNHVRSYDLQTGQLVWETTGTTLNAIPSPVEFQDSVICMAGYRGNRAVSISWNERGQAKVNWEIKRGTPYVPSPLLSENRLYFTKANQAILTCVDAETGEILFGPERLPGLENLYASPMVADGKIYITSREGTTIVLRDAPQFEILASNRLNDPVDASPVAVGRKLLLRGRNHLYCIEQ